MVSVSWSPTGDVQEGDLFSFGTPVLVNACLSTGSGIWTVIQSDLYCNQDTDGIGFNEYFGSSGSTVNPQYFFPARVYTPENWISWQ